MILRCDRRRRVDERENERMRRRRDKWTYLCWDILIFSEEQKQATELIYQSSCCLKNKIIECQKKSSHELQLVQNENSNYHKFTRFAISSNHRFTCTQIINLSTTFQLVSRSHHHHHQRNNILTLFLWDAKKRERKNVCCCFPYTIFNAVHTNFRMFSSSHSRIIRIQCIIIIVIFLCTTERSGTLAKRAREVGKGWRELQTHDVDNIANNLHRWTIISPFIVLMMLDAMDAQLYTNAAIRCDELSVCSSIYLFLCFFFSGNYFMLFCSHRRRFLAQFMPRRMKPIILITEQLCRTRIYNDRERWNEVEKISWTREGEREIHHKLQLQLAGRWGTTVQMEDDEAFWLDFFFCFCFFGILMSTNDVHLSLTSANARFFFRLDRYTLESCKRIDERETWKMKNDSMKASPGRKGRRMGKLMISSLSLLAVVCSSLDSAVVAVWGLAKSLSSPCSLSCQRSQ